MLSATERRLRAQLAARTRWAFEADRSAATLAARRAAIAKYEREVDPDGVLPVVERVRRAESLRAAHLTRARFASLKARRATMTT